MRSVVAAFAILYVGFAVMSGPVPEYAPLPSAMAEDMPLPSSACECDCDDDIAEIKSRLAALETSTLKATSVTSTRAAPVRAVVAATVRAVNPLPAARATWTYPGSIQGHLASSEHAGELVALGIQTAGMSRGEMEALHSSLHESRGTVTNQPMRQPVRYSTSNCPGGVCPTGPSVQRSSARWYFGRNLGR